MRYVGDVFESVVTLLPREVFVEHRSAIEDVRTSIAYSAPELEHLRWMQLSELLQDIIDPIPSCDWHYEVLSVFSTMPIEEIRRQAEELRRTCK
jgi:hypothetical protein